MAVVLTSSFAYDVAPEAWRAGLRSTFAALGGVGAHIIYLRDSPRPGIDIPVCMGRAAWRAAVLPSPACDFERDSSLGSDVYRAQKEAAEPHSTVMFVDLTNEICEGQRCRGEVGQQLIYRDSSHLTATFVRSLTPALEERLDRVLEKEPAHGSGDRSTVAPRHHQLRAEGRGASAR